GEQAADLRWREEVRGATAQVQLDGFAVVVEQGSDAPDLPVQHLQVMFAATVIARDDAIAAAVETRAFAERYMHVDRDSVRHRILVAAHDLFAQLPIAESFVESRGCRIGGVARTGAVIALQQGIVEGG